MPNVAVAQTSEAEALRITQMQLRQSEQERNALRAELARLQEQLNVQTSELDAARQQATVNSAPKGPSQNEKALQARLSKVSSSSKEMEQELEALRSERTRHVQAVENMKVMLGNTKRVSDQRNELLDLCRVRNEELYKVGHQIIDLAGDSDGRGVLRNEPVLQLSKVKLENTLQDFEVRLREQRIYEDTLPPSVEKEMLESQQRKGSDPASH